MGTGKSYGMYGDWGRGLEGTAGDADLTFAPIL